MRLILHDLTDEQFHLAGLHELPSDKNIIVSALGDNHYCIGCFACWLKTPGKCIIQDEYQGMGEKLSDVDKYLIISIATFGSYSSAVKNVLDRSISYVKPFFEMRSGEMHHRERYQKNLEISAIFYGQCPPWEQSTSEELVKANALNLNGNVGMVRFLDGWEELGEVLL